MNIVNRTYCKVKREYRNRFVIPRKVKGKQKIFCIGQNKTGTTSFQKAFKDLGYVVGNQPKAERLIRNYNRGDFDVIIEYCQSAQVFQDIPFSLPETFKYIDKAYPDARFILTIRDSPEQWYKSNIEYYSKASGLGRLPTKGDLQNATYRWKGWAWETTKVKIERYGLPENDLFNKEKLINSYLEFNKEVKDYFKNRPGKLLMINVAGKGSYQKLMKFLNIDSPYSKFPWKNKTRDSNLNWSS